MKEFEIQKNRMLRAEFNEVRGLTVRAYTDLLDQAISRISQNRTESLTDILVEPQIPLLEQIKRLGLFVDQSLVLAEIIDDSTRTAPYVVRGKIFGEWLWRPNDTPGQNLTGRDLPVKNIVSRLPDNFRTAAPTEGLIGWPELLEKNPYVAFVRNGIGPCIDMQYEAPTATEVSLLEKDGRKGIGVFAVLKRTPQGRMR